MFRDDELLHYGTPRKSGRYPWGSGEDPRGSRDYSSYVAALRREGMTDTQIANAMGMTTTEFRAKNATLKEETRAADLAQVQRMKAKGMSNVAIAERLGKNESYVRGLLKSSERIQAETIKSTAEVLKQVVEEKRLVDVGTGVEHQLGISEGRLRTAVKKLQEQGYEVHTVEIEQVGNPGFYTTVKVLAPPGTTRADVFKNRGDIKMVQRVSEDGGLTYDAIKPPIQLDPKRVQIRYAEEGGTAMDGTIELRRGVDDISLGGSRYSQVRIAVGEGHYLKGMAVYADDLPKGVDVRFNTNKSNTGNKLDAMKSIESDPTNPFGTIVRQRNYVDKDGVTKLSAINKVNDQGRWDEWNRTLASQVLSKQSPTLAKEQLGLAYDRQKAEYDRIMEVNNPAVRKRLLASFADGVDSATVHLKAAALPGQRTQVILPVTSLKPNEVYAPQFRNGDRLALVRFPHGGKFEIPEVTVNNRNQQGRKMIGPDALDAIGVHPKTASKLSGADFDGDTVLAIPNNRGRIKSEPSLKGLKDFDPKAAYPEYPGMKRMTERQKGTEMGMITNLITDMSIRGATQDEMARAVRHSMVVIDAAKHKLNYRQSAHDNGITALKTKYQNGPRSGATTLISQAKAEKRIPRRRAARVSEGGAIDPKTGARNWVNTGESYTNRKGETVFKTMASTRMAEAKDAFELSSGSLIEGVYATHANKLKGLANQARKSWVEQPNVKYDPRAKQAYAAEATALKAKLDRAIANRPFERQAQIIADANVRMKRAADPNMTKDELKKIKSLALAEARARVGATKASNGLDMSRIEITPREWDAIQAGAISNDMLDNILANTDLDRIREYATPKPKLTMPAAKRTRAKSLLDQGYTYQEVAETLGVSSSTLSKVMKEN